MLTNRRFLSADERGSITAVTNDAAAVLGRNAFDAFGAPGASNLGRFGYAGQASLPGGLWNMRARAYHPALGRFLQPDPIGMGGGMNLYAYAGNDPVNFVDPWGMQQKPKDEPPPPTGGYAEITTYGTRLSRDGASIVNYTGNYIDYAPGSYTHGVETRAGPCEEGSCTVPKWRSSGRAKDLTFLAGVEVFSLFRTPGLVILEAGLAKVAITPLSRIPYVEIADCVLCLAADTPVQTPTGLRPIQDLKVGDLVIAYDEATGKTEPKPVTALIRPLPKAVLDVEIASADGTVERVAATSDHPWLVVRGEGETAWVETLALKPGDQLVTQDADRLTFKSATLRDGLTQTYNLEVADLHTFLVGKDGVAVHNGCGAYVIRFLSGKVYVGKGNPARAARSAQRISTVTKDPVVGVRNYRAAGDRASYKLESRLLDKFGGPRSGQNYNRIQSPGKQYRDYDGY